MNIWLSAMARMRPDARSGSPRGIAPALLLVVLVYAAGAGLFAQAQNVWIDETTQLSGATLAPGTLLAWLTGATKIPFGVPPDRMPPVSYFIDALGWQLWGTNPLAFRIYHAVIAGAGLGLLVLATARRFGTQAALITGLVLALSPKLIDTAVEIRAYPIFFALSCAQLALLVRGDVAARPGRLALFLLLSLVSAYNHFFGVVASSAFFIAVFIDAPDVRSAVRAVAGYALVLLCCIGLKPFISGAAAISSLTQSATPGAGDIASFLVQLLGSGSLMVNPVIAVLYFGGVGLLVLLGAIGLGSVVLRRGVAARHEPALGIALALAAGIVVSIGAAFLLKGFNALSPRYSIWMLPGVALLIGLAGAGKIVPRGGIAALARAIGLALLAIGALWGASLFLKRVDWFVHGPSRAIETMIADADGPVALVHVGTGWPWGYFPLYWHHRDGLTQWLLTPDGKAVIRIGRGGDAKGSPQPLTALAGQQQLLVSRIDLLDFNDLRALQSAGRGEPREQTLELAPSLAAAGWRGGKAIYRPGNYAFTGQLYVKTMPRNPEPAK